MTSENRSSKFNLIFNKAKQLKCCFGQSKSPLLQRRRSRNANNDSGSLINDVSVGLNLSQLYSPEQQKPESSPISQTVSFAHSEERSASKITQLCLRFMLHQRLDAEMRPRAADMLQQAEQYVSHGRECENFASGQSPTSSSDGNCRVMRHRDNQAIARQLASIANQFCFTRAGKLAIERAGAMLLPPNLSLDEFRQCLDNQLVSLDSTHRRVALLMVLCVELGARAVVQCNGLALAIIVNWCCQLLCYHIAPIVIVRGWGQLISIAEATAARSYLGPSLLAALILIGCYSVGARFTKGS